MINTNNSNLMRYGKAKGAVLLEKYLPKLSPFEKIDIVPSIEKWNKIKDNYSERITTRTDAVIGDPRIVRVPGTSGLKKDVEDLIAQVKAQNPDGVVLIMEKKEDFEILPRYKYDGGFNIGFYLNDSVIIEMVGKGFDGREITREIGVHERYIIPWNEILFMRNKKDLMKSQNVSKYIVSDEEYQRTREERIKFLNSIESDKEVIQSNVPMQYTPIRDEFIETILDDIVFELYKRKDELRKDGLTIINVQGNFEDSRVVPWEIFRPERLITRDDFER